jgi:predicted GNAT family acetyltransferase
VQAAQPAGMKVGMATEVRNNRDQSRYELAIDEELVGIAEYRVVGDVVVFPHTEIERSLRGQGLGEQLVQYALDDVRGTNRRVVPQCWYVAEFIAEHPEYADLAS